MTIPSPPASLKVPFKASLPHILKFSALVNGFNLLFIILPPTSSVVSPPKFQAFFMLFLANLKLVNVIFSVTYSEAPYKPAVPKYCNALTFFGFILNSSS